MTLTDDDRASIRRRILEQRLTALEAEHVAATFAVEQLERQISEARADLEALPK